MFDVSRFASGHSYVLSKDVQNTKVDRRKRSGGPDFDAHPLFPAGLRFVFESWADREGGTTYRWEATTGLGNEWRYFTLEARERGGEVSMLPHPDHDAVHHRVACAVVGALVPEATTLASLQARAQAQHQSGWDVLAHLIERGLITVTNVESSVEHLLRMRMEEREAVIRQQAKAKKVKP